MNLAELKEENELEAGQVIEPVIEPVVEPEIDQIIEPVVDPVVEPELDEDGNPIIEEVPAWLLDEEADPQIAAGTVPLSALMRKKKQGKEQKAEIEDLKRQLAEQRQAPQSQQPAERPKMPRSEDFDTDAEHDTAMEQHKNYADTVRELGYKIHMMKADDLLSNKT